MIISAVQYDSGKIVSGPDGADEKPGDKLLA